MNIENFLIEQITVEYRNTFNEQIEITNAKPISGGCINHSLKLNTTIGDLFLKWNSNGPNDMFLREAESINEFNRSKNDFLVFPKPILTKKIDSSPGYLLMTYLEQGSLGDDDEKLGWGLAHLHQHCSNKFGFDKNNYCGATLQDNRFNVNWVKFYIENRIGHLLKLIRKFREWSIDDEKCLEQFLNKIPSLLSHKVKPSLIHGDLWSGNYMYTKAGPALIDPCASYCDREFEMGIMTMFGGFSSKVYDAYNEIYPLEYGWKERNKIYQLYHVLNHYLLFGGFYKSQSLEIMKSFI